MNNSIRILICLLTILMFLGCKEKLSEPISFFEQYDFNSREYSIEFYGLEGRRIDDFNNFYINDVETLNKMKKQWVFTSKSHVMPCGYGYGLNLIKDNKVVKKALINIDCEYMDGWIHFPKEYLEDHKSHFIRMK